VSTEGEEENKQPVPSHPVQKEALTALSILDSVIKCTNMDDKVKVKLSLCLTKYLATKTYPLLHYAPCHKDILG
jgi:hypothetical protein